MVTAKAFGMKVTRYFVGFGPTLCARSGGARPSTALKAIPLGGFCKIVGMTPQDDDVEPGDEQRAMWRYPVWKRTIVMSAGSVDPLRCSALVDALDRRRRSSGLPDHGRSRPTPARPAPSRAVRRATSRVRSGRPSSQRAPAPASRPGQPGRHGRAAATAT